jgi:ABC-type bacteriocin/lantibiotic exporter with double-glycine peptidase domain
MFQWLKRKPAHLAVPFYKQDKHYTCGPASLQMTLQFFGLRISEEELARLAKTSHAGTAHADLVCAARELGFHCYVNADAQLEEIKYFLNLGLPVVVNYVEPTDEDGHYAVAIGYTKNKIVLHDPWNGPNFTLSQEEFLRRWHDSTGSTHRWLLVLSNQGFNLGRHYAPAKERSAV